MSSKQNWMRNQGCLISKVVQERMTSYEFDRQHRFDSMNNLTLV
jgi:competence protein ComGC